MNKRQRQTEQTIKELVLLVPAFTYLHRASLKDDLTEEDAGTRDYILVKSISKTIAKRVRTHSGLQRRAIDLYNEIDAESKQDEYNVFMLGLCLLAKHQEVKGKRIHLGVIDEVLELQELSFSFYEAEEINRTADYADKIFNRLGL